MGTEKLNLNCGYTITQLNNLWAEFKKAMSNLEIFTVDNQPTLDNVFNS